MLGTLPDEIAEQYGVPFSVGSSGIGRRRVPARVEGLNTFPGRAAQVGRANNGGDSGA